MAIKLGRKNQGKKAEHQDEGWALPRLSRKNRRILAGSLCVIVALLLWRVFLGDGPRELPPEAVEQALSQTFSADSYRFTTEATVLLEGQQRLFCNLEGEKSGDNRHIWGELLGTPLNIYLVEGRMFQQSATDKSWREIGETDLASAAKLVGEIAPESNFSYAETGPISYLGSQEISGERLHEFTVRPQLKEVWIDQYFTDITGTLWLDAEGQYLVKAETTAVSRENPGVRLVINNNFYDFGAEIAISSPL